MDVEPEELQHLSIYGIYRESTNLIISWHLLFSQITASLILPLSLLFLAHIQISHTLFSQIDRNAKALNQTPTGSRSESLLLHRLSSEWLSFLLFKSLYLLFLLLFSLLSTSAIVYTVASSLTSKHHLLLSYSKVMSVVPKVWRRLAHTFLSAFLILLAYNLLAILSLFISLLLVGDGAIGISLVVVLVIVYVVGLVWISVVWHVASVVSVLEEARGVEAMRRSRGLVRGRMGVAVAVFVKMNLAFVGIEVGFRQMVVVGEGSVVVKVGLAGVMLALMSVVVLIALVAQTVVYFVCKSYHHQSVDKSALAEHLEVYLGEYVPLKERDVQMEEMRV